MSDFRWTEQVGDVWYGMAGNQIRAIFYFAEDAAEWRANDPLNHGTLDQLFDREEERKA